MKNLIFVFLSALLFTSCATYVRTTNPNGSVFSTPNQLNFSNFCNGTPVPICNNSGVASDRLYGGTIMTISGVLLSQVNSCSQGAFINGSWRQDCVYTINLMVSDPNQSNSASPRSIPISEAQMNALYNGQAIRVSFVW